MDRRGIKERKGKTRKSHERKLKQKKKKKRKSEKKKERRKPNRKKKERKTNRNKKTTGAKKKLNRKKRSPNRKGSTATYEHEKEKKLPAHGLQRDRLPSCGLRDLRSIIFGHRTGRDGRHLVVVSGCVTSSRSRDCAPPAF
jgi:hypothetical protein